MMPFQVRARCEQCAVVVGSWQNLYMWPVHPWIHHSHTVTIERANPGSSDWFRVGEQKSVLDAET